MKELARVLRRADPDVVRRVHVFDIAPQAMPGLFAASFADGDGAVHRCVVSYLLGTERKRLNTTRQWMGPAQVDGRIEIGANTGDLPRYLLPDAAATEDDIAVENRRQASYRCWLDAIADSGARAILRRVASQDEGIVVTAAAEGDQCLYRLDGRGVRSLEQTQKMLGLPRDDDVAAQADLYRDGMGAWRS